MGSLANARFSWNSGSKGADSIILAADEEKERLGREGWPHGMHAVLSFQVNCRSLLLWPAGDDLVLDLVVSCRRKNAASEELVLGSVGAAVDDALGVGVPDAANGLELVGSGGVDVERCGGGGNRPGCLGGCGGWRGEVGDGKYQQDDSEKLVAKTVHAWVSLSGHDAFMRKGTRTMTSGQCEIFLGFRGFS
jgi:hypothetical protein